MNDINLIAGKSLALPLQWMSDEFSYRPISAISLADGPPRITSVGHGVPPDWPVAITRVVGMRQINAQNNPPSDSDYIKAKKISADVIELNSVDATGYGAYDSGGFIQYRAPIDLTGFKARLQIRERKGGATLLFEMTTENGLIDIDNTKKLITLYFDSEDFDALTWTKGYYELELYQDVTRTVGTVTKTTEEVTQIAEGKIAISKETAL